MLPFKSAAILICQKKSFNLTKFISHNFFRQNMLPPKSVAKPVMISHNFVGSKTPAVATSGVTAAANMNVKRKLSDNISRIFVFPIIEPDEKKVLDVTIDIMRQKSCVTFQVFCFK